MTWLSAEWFCPGPPGIGGDSWCVYNAVKLAVSTPSVIASIVVGARTWRKRRQLNALDPRRTRTLADFFDKLVIILFAIDTVGSIPEFFYVFDTGAYPLRYMFMKIGVPVNTILYVEMLEGQVMLNAIWHCYMSYVMYAFIGLRKSVARLKREARPTKVLGAGLVGFVLYVVMWVLLWHDAVRRDSFRHIALIAMAFDVAVFPLCIFTMLAFYRLTWRALQGRSTEAAFLTGRYVRIRRKLMLITVIVPTALFLGMLGDVGQWLHHIRNDSSFSVVVFVFLRITMFRSIGLLDALIFGGAFDSCLDRADVPRDGATATSGQKPSNSQDNSLQYYPSLNTNEPPPPPAEPLPSNNKEMDASQHSQSQSVSVDFPLPPASPSLLHVGVHPFGAASGLIDQQSILRDALNGGLPPPPGLPMDAVSELTDPGLGPPAPVLPLGAVPAGAGGGGRSRVRIFASTYNVGDVVDVAALGPLEEWIPPGYDLYVFGFQECLILEPLRAAIHAALGKRAYDAFTREIGDTTILNGMIALTIFARTADVERGAVQVARSALGKIHSGMKLGPVRAANKGMVGISLRYHDVSIACCAAHFAADKHGKSGLARRNQDASRTLRELTLTHDDEEFDTHLQHDLTILLGDLNYRLTAPCQDILRLVSQASAIEDQKHQQKTTHTTNTWRQERYRRLFFLNSSQAAVAVASEGTMGPGRTSSHQRLPPLLAPQHSIKELDREEDTDEEGGGWDVNPSPLPTPTPESQTPPAPRPPTTPKAASTTPASNNKRTALPPRSPAHLAAAHAESSAGSAGRASNASSSVVPAGGGGSVALLRKYTSLSSAVTAELEVKPNRPWAWVRKVDELSLSMKKGHILYNFHEGPLLFPPSFRWIPGRVAGDFKDAAALEECYTLRVHSKKSGWSERPPSYTDRILFHALPDATPRLAVLGYEMCDSMTGSDHRPVCCRLELEVNSAVIGFNTLTPEEAAAAAAEALQAQAEQEEEEKEKEEDEAEGEAVEVLVFGGGGGGQDRAADDGSLSDIRVVAPPPPPPSSSTSVASADNPPKPQHERKRSRSLEEEALQPLQPPPLQPQSKSMTATTAASGATPPPKAHHAQHQPMRSSLFGGSGRLARALSRAGGGGSVGEGEVGGSSRSLVTMGRQPSTSSAGTGMTRAITVGHSSALSYRGPLAVWTVELTHLKLIGSEVDLPDVDEVTVLFPVSVEDPIALDRKSVVLDESFMDSGKRSGAGAGAPVSGALANFLRHHQHAHAAKALAQQGQGHNQDTHKSDPTVSTTHSAAPALDVIQNVHRISHRRMAQMRDKEGGARGLAITVSAVVAPGFTRHLLIKLLDPKGRGIGQGVISLREATALGPDDDLVVPLSLGGEPQIVHLALRVRLREDRAFIPTAGSMGNMGPVLQRGLSDAGLGVDE